MSAVLALLIVEDSTTDAKLVIQQLRAAGHQVSFERVEDEPGLTAALDARAWDAVICDWSMPRFSAGAALAVVKKRKLDIPFIIVSGTIGEEAAVDAMRAGAHDYVLKDRLGRLPPVLERELRERALREANRKSAEALAASESRFASLSESGIIGIVLSDGEGKIRETNDTFLKLVGRSRADLADGGFGWAQLTPPDLAASAQRQAATLREHGVAPPHETEYLRSDGTRVAVLTGAARLSDSRSIAFIVDRSAQKHAEEELARSVEQLRQAQKMEAVGRLAGGVAHDFNNLLSVILSYSSLMVEELGPTHPLRDDVEQINAAGLRAAALTKQLLTFSRQHATEYQQLDLGALVGGMETMLRRVLGEDVDLLCKVEGPLGTVHADPTSLEQVIMNLVVNSRDAMPTGGKLTLEARNVELDEAQCRTHLGATPGAYVLLAVSDTGSGMDASTQARIFEPFFTTKEKGKGTGLGLSTAFGIVQQCKGTIWVYSEPGRGTTFKIYLPRFTDEPGALAARPVIPASARGSERIMLVEDEQAVRAVARVILQGLGYQVLEASTADEALLGLERSAEKVDLLLTDVVMPQLSGPELARRALARWPHLKVLCMSGYTEEAVQRNGALDGSIPYLQKPITPDSLGKKVRQVLDGP